MLWLLKLTSPLVLVIKGGRVTPVKGRLTSSVLTEMQRIISGAEITRASIHAGGDGRYHFSPGIPVELHQSLRNVLNSA